MTKTIRIVTIMGCALAVYALGVFVRWGVLDVQEAREGPIPFTMESALAFRYGQLASQSALTAVDPLVGGPEGLKPLESLNLVAQVFWGKVYGWMKGDGCDALSLENFYHRIAAPVFCLGVLAAFGAAWVISGRLILSVLAGLGYAVLIPSVLRSTGQELMSENFSIPVLWVHFLFLILALKHFQAGRTRAFLLSTIASALCLALAWLIWDMVQVYVLVFALTWALVLGKIFGSKVTRLIAGSFSLALLGVSFLDPYLRSHGAWASQPLALLVALAAASFFPSPLVGGRQWRAGWGGMGLFCLIAVILLALPNLFPLTKDSYHHFAKLFWYKLKFLNIKPQDPALLPYEVRALWVPALHSATWARTWNYFGGALLLWVAAMALAGYRWIRHTLGPVEKTIACFGVAFVPLFVLFVRMEVWWIFFAVLGLVAVAPKQGAIRIVWISLIVTMLAVEARALVVQAPALGRNVDYRALNDVVRWVEKNTPEDAVILASYSLSPSFAAYAARPIILQPKYETPVFRERIKAFEEALIAEEESEFFFLCKTWGARYYIHSKGFYADHSLNSFRYLVGVTQPSGRTNLVKFEINPRFLNRFRLLYQNDKYLVYRVVDTNDLEKSQFCLNKGRACLEAGWPGGALRWCYRALALNPGEDRARLLAVKSYSAMRDVAGARQEATRLFERMQIRVFHPGTEGISR